MCWFPWQGRARCWLLQTEAAIWRLPQKLSLIHIWNTGLIPNLPPNACVEVPCLVDRDGIHPCYVGNLPEQCAAINRTNINVQLLTIQAAKSRRKEDIYMAAMMDPHTAAELSMDDIRAMCDEMLEAHGSWMPEYR